MNVTDVISLSDDKEYIVAGKILHHDKTYVCLVEFNNQTNIRYGYLDKDEIVFLKKDNIDQIILLKLINDMTKNLKKMS